MTNTDIAETKRRPTVVLSSDDVFNKQAHACVLAMVTSSVHSPWPCDVEIGDLKAAGLPTKSLIRMKLFTLDERLIFKTIGKLSSQDQKSLTKNLHKLLGL